MRLYQVALRLPSLVAALERNDTAEVLQTIYAAPLKVRGGRDWRYCCSYLVYML